MNNRQLTGFTICVMYALLLAACITYAALGLAPNLYVRESVLELPIFFQLLISQALGLTPLWDRLTAATHWTVPYTIIIVSSFGALYWTGWWMARIDEP